MNIWQKSGILVATTALIGSALLAGAAYAQTPTPEAEATTSAATPATAATVEPTKAAERTTPGADWFGGRMFQGKGDGPAGWMGRLGSRMMPRGQHRGEHMGSPGMMQRGGMMGLPFGGGLMGHEEQLALVAQALDLDVEALQTAIQEGKTLVEIATAQGMDEAEWQAAFQATLGQWLDQAVKDGKLTEAQATALSERMVNALPLLGQFGRGMNRGMLGQQFGANLLGDPRELLAEATGMTVAELETALTATVEKRLAAAVEQGDLTQAQADSIKARMEAGDSFFGGALRGWLGK